ncbi:MAG: DUF4145 domain-containing protein [Pirellulales bacterium]|nr:DUF4145 domain-containing protein [Pirellulales bacterium]
MFTLPLEAVPNWINVSSFWLPQSVDFVCPHCGREVNFALTNWQHVNRRSAASAAANCPGCRKEVRFWAIDPSKYGDTGSKECAELCMHPTPTVKRSMMRGLDRVPPEIARAYVSALSALNAGVWNGTAALVGRALEGLVKNLMPKDKQKLPLAQMLAELPDTVDLPKTLRTLTDGLRKGRNIGAHFDLDKEADEEMANMMVEFLEYFLEYLYIVPAKVDDLHRRL